MFERKILVRFEDGQYGVRVGWPPYSFVDLKNNKYTWELGNHNFNRCKGTKAQAEDVLNPDSYDYELSG